MAIDLKELKAKMAKNPDLKNSLKTLVDTLANELGNLTQDPVAIKAMSDDLRRDSDAIAQSVIDGTHQPNDRGNVSPTTAKK